jgi:hypothetical protein
MFGLISIDYIGNDGAMFYSEIMEPPGHHSLIVLEVDEETPSLTAPGDERLLVHVECDPS